LYSEENRFWLAFSLVHSIGTKRIQHLAQSFGSLAAAWSATEAELKRAGLEESPRTQLLKARTTMNIDEEIRKIERASARFLTLADGAYPAMLKALPDAPPVLYVLGELTSQDEKALAVVGTRKATKMGRDAALDLSQELARNGVTIVSGLAPGIDAAAHEGALQGGGRTLAVLGSGIDRIYPRENLELARRVYKSGAILSEFPIGTPPEKRNFPRRNRVISGLSLGVLVVEAPEGSGALITAHDAADQGRDVFAVPSSIYNTMGAGTNRLIQDGAKLVMNAEDILSELNITHQNISVRTKAERIAPENPIEVILLQHLSVEPLHVDELARMCGLPIPTVMSTLTLLELKGLAQMVGQMQYSLAYE
jgi:DNA processing protein